jgi:hypothetical protein
MADKRNNQLPDIDLGRLNIREDDKVARKLLMLVEGTFGIGVGKALEKYGYTEPRFYQLKKDFIEKGSDALVDGKRGPKTNHVRRESVDMRIIRMKFLDPDCGAGVIAQKLNQSGIKISRRSVERTITHYGLQKKTSSG